ncbi:Transcriptional regulator, LacI family [Candidatus Rhodobacter oscarellae]|uniref:Transcriptional regulator, LacI family n=1 Tax=Candidatus Rhodobacter oscarellae TaxID=1675527 RepID=A0A0J9E2Z6_9RHOB|nr:LacI family DNA-binding transcriptional regulator [Candidatus Rhodobacter lobularis]KMW57105.1 Transcriptional regulator, LacI family [Candidatus Rhodobacter lobularis]
MPVTTIEDVADRAGVSPATVDRVIHGRGKPRNGTIARVKEAIEALGYRPNLAASTLARGKIRRLGLVIPDWDVEFLKGLADQAADLDEELELAGASVHMLKCDETDPAAFAENFEAFAEELDGCAVLAPNDPAVVEAIARLEANGVRIATIVTEIPTSARTLFVGPNNRDLGATAACLLAPTLERVDGPVAVLKPAALQEDHEARYVGFCTALRGIGIDPSRIKTFVGRNQDSEDDIAAHAIKELGPHALTGAYMTGGGLGAQMAALTASQAGKPVTVATDLTSLSRKLLLSQDLNFVVASDVKDMVNTAFVSLLRTLNEPLWKPKAGFQQVQVFTRFNLPQQP